MQERIYELMSYLAKEEDSDKMRHLQGAIQTLQAVIDVDFLEEDAVDADYSPDPSSAG